MPQETANTNRAKTTGRDRTAKTVFKKLALAIR